MGVDFSHGDAHFGPGSFQSFRKALAAMIGPVLDNMQGFGGQSPWETIADSLAPLRSRNDAGGEMTPEEAPGAAARLEAILRGASAKSLVPGADRIPLAG